MQLIVSQAQLPVIQKAVISGLEVAAGARSKRTYYHTAEEQQKAVFDAVEKLYAVSKELPLLLANQQGATGFFITAAVLNELENTVNGGANRIVDPRDWLDERLGTAMLYNAVGRLDESAGIPYVLRMFTQYRERSINNARARKLALRFILGHHNLEFIAVKYRDKIEQILTHAWGQRMTSILLSILGKVFHGEAVFTEKEASILHSNLYTYNRASTDIVEKVVLYVFGRDEGVEYPEDKFPTIAQAIRARTDILGCNLVPAEVLEGLVSSPNHPQHDLLWGSEEAQKATRGRLAKENKAETANQSVRKTRQREKLGVEVESRVGEATDPTAIMKTAYENGWTSELSARIVDLAQKDAYRDFPYNGIAIVIDHSKSMTGDWQESKNTPLAISEYTGYVLQASVEQAEFYCPDGDSTDIAKSVLDALADNPQAVFILSDGYENSYDGLTHQLVKKYRALTGDQTPIWHISPQGSAEMGMKARTLGEGIVSLSTTYKGLPMQMQAKMLEADVTAWLQAEFEKFSRRLDGGEK